MRWINVLILVCVVAPAYGQQNEAEKLYQAMEKKIRSAKSLQVVVRTELVQDQQPDIVVTGTLYHAQGNKGRLRMEARIEGKSVYSVVLVSDGKLLYMKEVGEKGSLEKIPKHLEDTDKSTPALVARIGTISSFFVGQLVVGNTSDPAKMDTFDVDKALPAKGFKLAGTEKIGHRKAHVVEYLIESQHSKVPIKATVWIDAQTQLPLKRALIAEFRKVSRRITETYNEFILDPKLDAKLFEIPK
jgi:outer membrane lipoprotein-sorting protein